MSNNICDDGTLATSSRPCLVEWLSQEDFDKVPYDNPSVYHPNDDFAKGPITAMNYLYKATKNWNNIPNININYTSNTCYGEIKTNDNITKITMVDGTVTSTYENLKARFYSSTGNIYDDNNIVFTYLVNGLTSYPEIYPVGTKEDIEGYWSFDSDAIPYAYQDFCNLALNISYIGNVYYINSNSSDIRVRTVIEVLKSNLS